VDVFVVSGLAAGERFRAHAGVVAGYGAFEIFFEKFI